MDLSRDQKLGVFFMLFAALLVLAWVPADVETGLIEKVRRQVLIGDALAPSLAGLFLFLGGLGQLLSRAAQREPQTRLDFVAMRFAALLFAVYAGAFFLMLFIGPFAVWITNLTTGGDQEYRLLRDTAPWKYLGFSIGGTLAITATVSLVEGRMRWRTIACAVLAVGAMIAVYDLPFDDLLLPPNGDF